MKGLLALLLGSALVGGCSLEHPAAAMLEDYRQRLANVTRVDYDSIARLPDPELQLEALPRRRQRVLPLSEIRIGLWDYLQIYGCQLNQLVSERNSSLGKVMPPSRRLVYETKLVYEISRCLVELRTVASPEDELVQELEQALAVKRAELHMVAWNALFGSAEFESLASLAVSALHPAEVEPLIIGRQALDALLRVALMVEETQANPQHKPDFDVGQLEDNLQLISTQQSIGRLLQSIKLASVELDNASAILRHAHQENSLCPMGKRTLQADYLNNVFSKYYAGRVQPYLSMLNREGGALLEAAERLLAKYQAAIPVSFQDWQRGSLALRAEAGAWQHFQSAISRHTRAWQHLLQSCDMAPAAR